MEFIQASIIFEEIKKEIFVREDKKKKILIRKKNKNRKSFGTIV